MMPLQQSLNSLLLVGLLFIAPGCTQIDVRAQTVETETADSRPKILTKDELYFGLSKPEGGMLSEKEWQLFLNRAITPRFKEGLTVLDADGQYLNSKGELVKEKTKLVILIYENTPTKNKYIEEIIASYKQSFRQESVLRVTSSVKVSF